ERARDLTRSRGDGVDHSSPGPPSVRWRTTPSSFAPPQEQDGNSPTRRRLRGQEQVPTPPTMRRRRPSSRQSFACASCLPNVQAGCPRLAEGADRQVDGGGENGGVVGERQHAVAEHL